MILGMFLGIVKASRLIILLVVGNAIHLVLDPVSHPLLMIYFTIIYSFIIFACNQYNHQLCQT